MLYSISIVICNFSNYNNKKMTEKNNTNGVEANFQTKETTEDVKPIINDDDMKKQPKKGSKAALEMEIEELQQEVGELKDKYIRHVAEFDNYKKRNARERIDLLQNAAKDTISSLIPVLDDFDRAIKAGDADDNIEPVSEGVKLIYNRLKNTLVQQGLREMETHEQVFDAELHEALTEIPAPNDDMKGKIMDTIEKGYYLNDKIIRHARVVVGK